MILCDPNSFPTRDRSSHVIAHSGEFLLINRYDLVIVDLHLPSQPKRGERAELCSVEGLCARRQIL